MKICNYPTCEARARSKGFCDKHYRRHERLKQALASLQEGGVRESMLDYHCCYIIGAVELPYVKIGRSKRVLKRINDLQVGNPLKLQFLGGVWCNEPASIAIEYETHQVLMEFEFHLRGEWFDVSPQDALSVMLKNAERHDLVTIELAEYHRAIHNAGRDDRRPIVWDKENELRQLLTKTQDIAR